MDEKGVKDRQAITIQLPRELYERLVAEADRRGCWKRRVVIDALVRALTTQPGQQVA